MSRYSTRSYAFAFKGFNDQAMIVVKEFVIMQTSTLIQLLLVWKINVKYHVTCYQWQEEEKCSQEITVAVAHSVKPMWNFLWPLTITIP